MDLRERKVLRLVFDVRDVQWIVVVVVVSAASGRVIVVVVSSCQVLKAQDHNIKIKNQRLKF
jgi:hypothetical protein